MPSLYPHEVRKITQGAGAASGFAGFFFPSLRARGLGEEKPVPPYSAIVYKEGDEVRAEDWKGRKIASGESGVDDASVIQSAVDIGGTVILKGSFYLNARITTPNNVDIIGAGDTEGKTEIDISALSGSSPWLTMGDYCSLRNLKIKGPSTFGDSDWVGIQTGNHALIKNVHIYQCTYGIDTTNKIDVRIEGVIFEKVHGGQGWASCIHASGNSNGIYVRGFYAYDCDRGFEIEDGAKNVFVSDGYLEDIDDFAVSCHSHENGGGVDNTVFRNIYTYHCRKAIWAERVSGTNDADLPRNVIFDGIIVDTPYVSSYKNICRLDGYNIIVRNCKIINTPSTDGTYNNERDVEACVGKIRIESIYISNSSAAYEAIRVSCDNSAVLNSYIDTSATYGVLLVGSNNAVIACEVDGGSYSISLRGTRNICDKCNLLTTLHVLDASDAVVRDCDFSSITAEKVRFEGTNTIRFYNNKAYVTGNSCTATFSGDGTTTQFSIAHGLVSEPSKVQVTPMTEDAAGDFYVTKDSANIYVNYLSPPPSGSDNIKLSWYAEV